MEDDYRDIAPYEGQDFEDAMQRLIQYPQLLNNFTDIISRHSRLVNKWKSFHAKGLLSHMLTQVHSYMDFQKYITCDIFLEMIESSSIDDFTFGGMENIEGDEPHVYISNHRDIVLDAALLDLALYRSGKMQGEMVIGDNLLVNSFATDIFKVNGAITFKRSLQSAADLRKETLRLSRYIRHCIETRKCSVWIAQKSGRSKDGIDNTSPAILKMLYLAYREDGISFADFLKKSSIVPVSISYQYDPCDISKSEDQIRKLKAEGCYNVYVKKKYADVLDMVRGLRMNKGNVHIQIGSPLDGDVISDVRAATREMDRQIHMNYKLWDTNYFAYDKLSKAKEFASEYKDMNTKSFVKHYRHLKPEVKEYVYNSYANPVRSMLSEKNPVEESDEKS
ncbi:MAG: 1-acyl-sn-glycerol-3-phosphate acyltransferase [Sphaerochaetaceae bacterium]|nr:1-acyl-sn-glycerol-3-phosphate acyltransferase [Sphaerochaetaceae bacterium]